MATQPLGPKSPFGIDVHGLALAAALVERELRRDTERVAQLRLARAELAVEFCETTSLDATSKSLSSSFEPVDSWTMFCLCSSSAAAVVKVDGTIL